MQMELQKLYPDETLFKVFCQAFFKKASRFPFTKDLVFSPFLIYDYFSSYMA